MKKIYSLPAKTSTTFETSCVCWRLHRSKQLQMLN